MKSLSELQDHLSKIDINLMVVQDTTGTPLMIKYFTAPISNDCIYDFQKHEYNNSNIQRYISDEIDDVAELIDKFEESQEPMDTDFLESKLYSISKNLELEHLPFDPYTPLTIYFSDNNHDNDEIYDFESKIYQSTNVIHDLEPETFTAIQKIINDYWQKSKDSQTISNDSESKKGLTMGSAELTSNDNQMIPKDNTDYANHKDEINKVAEQIKYVPMVNPFAKYTEKLATVLKAKNVAYGDSFTKSVDDYGLKVIGIRLSDKYNRVKHLVNHGLLKQNDESLEDTLLDMAGYSILSLKYLKEHKKELENAN